MEGINFLMHRREKTIPVRSPWGYGNQGYGFAPGFSGGFGNMQAVPGYGGFPGGGFDQGYGPGYGGYGPGYGNLGGYGGFGPSYGNFGGYGPGYGGGFGLNPAIGAGLLGLGLGYLGGEIVDHDKRYY
jgi:hypothetical protein